jgi:hypothetical protein
LNLGSYSPCVLNLRQTQKLIRICSDKVFRYLNKIASLSAFEVKYLPGEKDVVDGEDTWEKPALSAGG